MYFVISCVIPTADRNRWDGPAKSLNLGGAPRHGKLESRGEGLPRNYDFFWGGDQKYYLIFRAFYAFPIGNYAFPIGKCPLARYTPWNYDPGGSPQKLKSRGRGAPEMD